MGTLNSNSAPNFNLISDKLPFYDFLFYRFISIENFPLLSIKENFYLFVKTQISLNK